MKLLRYSGPVILLAIGFIGLFTLSSMRKAPQQRAAKSKRALVDVAEVESCNEGFNIAIDGEVVPFRQVNLAAQVGGQIAKKNPQARSGHYVSKGDLLFEIDPRDYELDVRNLTENVNKAESSIKELEVERFSAMKMIELAEKSLKLQTSQVERLEELKSKQATSVTQLDQARMTEIQNRNSLQTQRNQINLIDARRNRLLQDIEQAKTGLQQADLALSRTRIESPIDGVVIQDFAEQDDFVQPGTRVVQLEDTSKVEVRFNLRMEQLQWLWNAKPTNAEANNASPYQYQLPATPVVVSVDLNGNQFQWNATLSRYDGAGITSGTRTVPVIAVVNDPSQVTVVGANTGAAPPTLLRGSFVSVALPVGSGMELVAIPAEAYQPDRSVWIYRDGKLKVQPIDVAYSDESRVIAIANELLQPGAQVVITPLPVAEEGMELRLPGEADDEETGDKAKEETPGVTSAEFTDNTKKTTAAAAVARDPSDGKAR